MEPKSTITVVQEGNRRGNAVTLDEIKQGILDLANFFETKAKDIAKNLKSVKPATAEELQKLKDITKTTVPASLELLLSTYNGGLLIRDTYKTLSVDNISEAIDESQVNGYWKKNYIPFAKDDENNYLCIEHDNGNELKVVSWSGDMGVIEEVSDGLGLLIEKTRDGVLKNKIQYVEGAGLIEDSS